MTPVKLCKCLSDETRLKLVGLLSQYEELCVCDLVDVLSVPQSTVSRHLAQLRECGLVSVRRDAQWIYYQLADSLPGWAMEVIQALVEPVRVTYPELAQRPAAGCA